MTATLLTQIGNPQSVYVKQQMALPFQISANLHYNFLMNEHCSNWTAKQRNGFSTDTKHIESVPVDKSTLLFLPSKWGPERDYPKEHGFF
jgi:hypothetical protein